MEQTTQQIQSNHKRKASASLILGVLTFSPVLLFIFLMLLGLLRLSQHIYLMFAWPTLGLLVFLVDNFYLLLLTFSAGLILGILGLKSKEKKWAIFGIILSILGIIVDYLIRRYGGLEIP